MTERDEIHTGATIAFGPSICLRGVRKRFAPNTEIFGEGQTADHIYRVISGAVRKMRYTGDGRRQILSFLLPGDVFGLEIGHSHTLSAEAIAKSEVVLVRRALLDKVTQGDPQATRCWLKHASDNLARSRDHALLLGRKSASERLATFLLDMSERLVRGRDFELPMTRADIADYLGLTVESVSRSFTEMERAQAIDLPTSRHVVVRSRSALDQLQAA